MQLCALYGNIKRNKYSIDTCVLQDAVAQLKTCSCPTSDMLRKSSINSHFLHLQAMFCVKMIHFIKLSHLHTLDSFRTSTWLQDQLVKQLHLLVLITIYEGR